MPDSPETHPDTMKWLGSLLREIRQAHNMTQAQLCANEIDPFGPSESCTVSRVENAKQKPSAFMIDNFLGKMDEPTFPWGYLFCMNGLDFNVAKQRLREELRIGVLTGKISQIYAYYTGRTPLNNHSEGWYDMIPELICACKQLGKTKDDALFINFIEKYYLTFPYLTPGEIIETERGMLTNLRGWDEVKDLRSMFLPNETEKMIITDMALRYIDAGLYDLALELLSCLLQKKNTAMLLNSDFWRIISIYHYNEVLCYLLSGKPKTAFSTVKKGLYALNHGGDNLIQMYYKALFVRLLQAEGAYADMKSAYHAFKQECSIQKDYFGFAYDEEDLINSTHGLPAL